MRDHDTRHSQPREQPEHAQEKDAKFNENNEGLLCGFNVVMIFLALAALIALLVLLAEYYLVYKVWFDAINGTCVTSYSMYHEEDARCTVSCGKNCHHTHEYPCLLIYAKFFEGQSNSSIPTSISNKSDDLSQVYRNEKAYDPRKSHCSYLPKCMEYSMAAKEVSQYRAKFGTSGTKYNCLQKRDEPESVIQELTGNKTIIHFFTWPSLIFLLCIIYFVIIRLKFPEENIWFVLGLEWLCCCKECPVNKECRRRLDAENNASRNVSTDGNTAASCNCTNNYGNGYSNNANCNSYGWTYGRQGYTKSGFYYGIQHN